MPMWRLRPEDAVLATLASARIAGLAGRTGRIVARCVEVLLPANCDCVMGRRIAGVAVRLGVGVVSGRFTRGFWPRFGRGVSARLRPTGLGWRSIISVILPSTRWIWRSHFLARSASCVTIIKVIALFLLSAKSRFIILSPVAESRLPVGSSAKIISGRFTIARAMQTRCFCPPERFLAFCLALDFRPTILRAVRAVLRAFK